MRVLRSQGAKLVVIGTQLLAQALAVDQSDGLLTTIIGSSNHGAWAGKLI